MKSFVALLFLSVVLCAGCKGSAPLPPKAIDLNNQGADALADGDLETAEARFDLALEYSPRFVEALVNRALVEVQRGNFLRARRLLARARRYNPDFAQPHHGFGVLEEREGRPDKASKHYLEALSIDPGFAAARLNLARLYYSAGKYEHAKEQFKRVVEVSPSSADGYVGLAEALIKLDRSTEADDVVESAFQEFPDHPALAILQARAHLRRNKVDTAVRLLLPLTSDRDEVAVSALGWLGTAELARGRPVAAEKAALRALSLAPKDAVADYVLKQARMHR
ncbi:MAG TPA: tetratricopeptide repeat protein [Polyangiaceae bacterium]|nr:tetratricopeptide repeat protein [Polyangiaceae bacterium]HMR74326.1 tetratricopeptide repeat protein [Polyangiaceae bacterium]